MAKNSVGVYQKDNGYWEYRFVMMVDGKQINKKKSTDAQGNKLKTKTEAIRAREAAMAAAVGTAISEKTRKDIPPFRLPLFALICHSAFEKVHLFNDWRTEKCHETIL